MLLGPREEQTFDLRVLQGIKTEVGRLSCIGCSSYSVSILPVAQLVFSQHRAFDCSFRTLDIKMSLVRFQAGRSVTSEVYEISFLRYIFRESAGCHDDNMTHLTCSVLVITLSSGYDSIHLKKSARPQLQHINNINYRTTSKPKSRLEASGSMGSFLKHSSHCRPSS